MKSEKKIVETRHGTSLLFLLWIQILAFAVVSLVLLLLLRPVAMKYIKPKTVTTNYDSLVGLEAKVTVDILPGKWGHVEVNGVDWSAKSKNDEAIPAGEKVKVLAVEGAKLIVRKEN